MPTTHKIVCFIDCRTTTTPGSDNCVYVWCGVAKQINFQTKEKKGTVGKGIALSSLSLLATRIRIHYPYIPHGWRCVLTKKKQFHYSMGNWKWCIGARAPRVFRCFHFPSHSVIYLGWCGFSCALSHPLARILARLLVLTYYSHLVLCVCERALSSIYNWISTVLHRTYAANAIVYRPYE